VITKTDFIGIPSQDSERSRRFYVETLGLRPDERGKFEFWAGETCFGIWEPARQGMEFAPQKNAHPALHVDDVAFFQAGDMVLALWDRTKLAEDSAVDDGGGWGGVTLALNLGSSAEVDTVIEEARSAGATIGRAPAETFWGGYSGIFIDPDGHPWEVAHNPHWTITEDGGVRLS